MPAPRFGKIFLQSLVFLYKSTLTFEVHLYYIFFTNAEDSSEHPPAKPDK